MAALTDLPSDLEIEDVAHIVYRSPYFALDGTPIAGLTVGPTKRVHAPAGSTYTSTLVNGLDVTVKNPSVTIFPVNEVGRPLGVAIARGTIELAPAGRWAFETNAVDAPGVDAFAYPAGAL
jgi:hypothetical protein